MELKDIITFQNGLLVGLAGVSWKMFFWKLDNMCKRIHSIEKTMIDHLIKSNRQ